MDAQLSRSGCWWGWDCTRFELIVELVGGWVGGWAQMRSTPSHYTLNVDFWLDPTFVQGCIQSGSADC